MGPNSERQTLAEVCSAIVDCEHKTAPAGEGNAYSIRTTDIRDGRIDFQSAKRVTEETWKVWSHRLAPREGDLILAREAPVGAIGRVPTGVKACLGQRTVLLRPNEDRADSRYLHFLLMGPVMQRELNRLAAGSTVEHLNVADIRTLRLPELPCLTEQRRIAGVLGALDDKVEHNRTLAERLAATASAGFALFAARSAATGQMGSLSDLGAPASDRLANGIGADLPYIGLDAMPRGSPVLREWTIEDAPTGQATRFSQGDILFGKLRPYFKKVGIAPIDGRCSTEILVLRPATADLWGPLLGWVLTDAFIAYCVAHAVGTKMPRSEWRDVQSFPVPLPSPDDATRCTWFMRSIFNLVIALVHESQRLTAIRDALLPTLVSGKLLVPQSYHPESAGGELAESAEALAKAVT